MIVTIHQPNYLPYLGFFHKALHAQAVVLFDNVPMPQGKSWVSRNRINLNGVEHWLTVPVKKSGRSGQLIHEVELIDDTWKRVHLKTIHQAYCKAPFYAALKSRLENVYAGQFNSLIELNEALIRFVLETLHFKGELLRGSSRVKSDNRQTDMIVETCVAFGTKIYLTGTGCLDFLEPEKFDMPGIEVRFQKFTHPEYPVPPHKKFIVNMAVLDALFYMGPDKLSQNLLAQEWK